MNYSKDDFKALFQAKFDYTKWFAMLKDFFKADELRTTAEPISDPADCDKGFYIGAINTSDSYRIGLFYYEIGHSNVARKKVGLRNLVRTFINPNWGQFDAALAVFSDGEHWRLSLISDIKGEATATKRYTFVFGEKDNLYRTAIERFALIRSEGPSFETLKKAFSVEALTEEFFGLYKEHYERFCDFIYQNAEDPRFFGPEFAQWNSNEDSQKYIRDYVKNLMGRIVFLQFLQKKGWMGVPTDRNDWTGGDPYFMQHLYDYATEEQKEDFLDEVLEPLFFNCLNALRPNDVFDTNVNGIGTVKVPYLNGELFEQKEVDKAQSKFPQKYFHDLLNLFLQYNFTIDENDPNDAEIGVDPEMLGKIFENLLEDNKDKGAFYTPKEIVRYMCKESLISYLCSNNGVKHADSIKTLVNNHQLTDKLQEDVKTCERLNKHLRNVKVCDPAIGSGAFPMGLMNEIFACRSVLHENIEETDEETSGQIKREIIQNNIYGVDIEQGAVDIARLRFWLALMVDSVKPEPLPNLDYKIMQGNSLIESYKGLDLSNLLHSNNLFVATQEEELGKYMKRYFRATDNEEKRKLRNQIDFTVKQCIYAAGIQDTVELPNTDFFLWHTYFHDVFKEGGFDIVIGNPPYGANIDNLIPIYKKLYPKTSHGYKDIYKYFFDFARSICKNNGTISYITPNTYLRQTRYGDLRRLLLQSTISQLLDLGEKIFKDAVVPVAVCVLNNQHPVDVMVKFVDLTASITIENANEVLGMIPFKPIKQDDWNNTVNNIFIENIVQKKNNEVLLDDILEMKDCGFKYQRFNVGLAQKGKNDLADRLFYKSSNGTKEDIRDIPILIGKDIFPYYHTDTPNKVLRYNYESLLKDNETTYYNKKIMGEPVKLIWRQTAPYFIGTILKDNTFFGNTIQAGIIKSSYRNSVSYEYLCALLNSKYLRHRYEQNVKEEGRVFPQVKLEKLRPLPIVLPTKDQLDKVNRLVNEIVALKQSNRVTTDLEVDIDNLVFKLYGLSFSEVKQVFPENTISEEEYNHLALI